MTILNRKIGQRCMSLEDEVSSVQLQFETMQEEAKEFKAASARVRRRNLLAPLLLRPVFSETRGEPRRGDYLDFRSGMPDG